MTLEKSLKKIKMFLTKIQKLFLVIKTKLCFLNNTHLHIKITLNMNIKENVLTYYQLILSDRFIIDTFITVSFQNNGIKIQFNLITYF